MNCIIIYKIVSQIYYTELPRCTRSNFIICFMNKKFQINIDFYETFSRNVRIHRSFLQFEINLIDIRRI